MEQSELEHQHKTLMQELGKLYAKHTRLGLDDHEPTTDKMCIVCDAIQTKTKEIQKLERELRQLLKPTKPKQKAPSLHAITTTVVHDDKYIGPEIYQVTTNEKRSYLYRTKSKEQIKLLKLNQMILNSALKH